MTDAIFRVLPVIGKCFLSESSYSLTVASASKRPKVKMYLFIRHNGQTAGEERPVVLTSMNTAELDFS